MSTSKTTALFVLVFLLSLCSCGKNNDNASQSEQSHTEQEIIDKDTHSESNWQYTTKQDPMDDSFTYMANCTSTDKADISGNYTRLHLGLINTNGVSMIIIMPEKGMLREDKLPMVYARFDGGDVQTFAVIPDNGKSIYIADYDTFFDQLLKSKKLALKVETGDYGTATFTFNTEGLVWEHHKM